MDTIFDFLNAASALQLSMLVAAIVVWTMGGSFLKKRLLQRLNAESEKQVDLEDVRFEDISANDWKTFAALCALFAVLVFIAVKLL